MAAALTLLGALVAGCGSVRTVTVTEAAPLVPGCPHPTYTADGNLNPLYCRVDNPLALRFYSPLVDKLIALGPDASPRQVEAVVQRTPGLTETESCNSYALAAWAEHWHFGTNPVGTVCA